MKKIVLNGILCVLGLVASPAFAAGLVPCGGYGEEPCNYNDIITTINNVLNAGITYIVIPVLTILIIVGGFKMMTAAGNESKFKEGIAMIRGVIWGFGFAFLAWAIVKTVLYFLGV